jgi:hypothetical protein
MLVKLRRGWFDPAGNRRRVEDNPHDFPDDWKDKLPSTAEVVPAAEVKAIAKAEKEAEKEAK